MFRGVGAGGAFDRIKHPAAVAGGVLSSCRGVGADPAGVWVYVVPCIPSVGFSVALWRLFTAWVYSV